MNLILGGENEDGVESNAMEIVDYVSFYGLIAFGIVFLFLLVRFMRGKMEQKATEVTDAEEIEE